MGCVEMKESLNRETSAAPALDVFSAEESFPIDPIPPFLGVEGALWELSRETEDRATE